jgi:hypothetical protein
MTPVPVLSDLLSRSRSATASPDSLAVLGVDLSVSRWFYDAADRCVLSRLILTTNAGRVL